MDNSQSNKCLKCERIISPFLITFDCSHQFCPSCFAYSFFKSPLLNTFFDDNREMVILCSCQKGKTTLNLDQMISYFRKNQIKAPQCENHKDQCTFYCNICKKWLCSQCLSLFHNSYFSNHTLSLAPQSSNDKLCEKHNKRLKIKCLTCKAYICSNCLIESHNEHKVINYKSIIKSKLKFASFNDYDDYLTKREIQLKDELHFANKEICLKLETAIDYLRSAKAKIMENYYNNCKFITDLNNFTRRLYYFLYESIASNDPQVNPLLDLSDGDIVYVDIGLKHYPQTDYDSLLYICEKLTENRVDCTIQLVGLNLYCQKSFLSEQKEHINAICQIKKDVLAIGSVAKGLELVDISDLDNIKSSTIEAHSNSITELLSRQQGNLISCSLDYQIKIWQIESISQSQLVKSLSGHKDGINTMILISNNRLASGAKDNNIRIWDMKELKYIKTLSNHKKEINRMICINKTKIGSASLDMTMCLWDVDKGTCCLVVNLKLGLITSMLIFGDSMYTGMEKDNTMIKWSMGTISMESGIKTHQGLITQSICLSNGQIATSSLDQTIVIWDIKQAKSSGTLISHRAPIHALTQLSDNRIVSGSDDGMIKFWSFI